MNPGDIFQILLAIGFMIPMVTIIGIMLIVSWKFLRSLWEDEIF